ncbi:hypothetical protein MKY84_09240 [Chryseomicrobium sp. FSL W7-1435]|uniref:hypothetical protein n=1 Tax=Chryseomicrobium sp. FSL W7-1435 TaxID=2921704 RepID=UPI00315AF07D
MDYSLIKMGLAIITTQYSLITDLPDHQNWLITHQNYLIAHQIQFIAHHGFNFTALSI